MLVLEDNFTPNFWEFPCTEDYTESVHKNIDKTIKNHNGTKLINH